MDRIAIMEISEIGTRMIIMHSRQGRYKILKENFDPFPIGQEIEEDQLLKPKTISKIISVLTTYREFAEAYQVEKVVGVASNYLVKARNQKGFFEEVYNNTGVAFAPMQPEECIKNLFIAYNASIDVSKAYSIYVGNYSTIFMRYNRRTVLDSFIIPYGVFNIISASESREERVKIVLESIRQHMTFQIEPGDACVCAGSAFINFGRVAKKVDHYQIDIDNNYEVSKKLAKEVFDFVGGLDFEKIRKVKNVIGKPAEFVSGLAIIEGIFEAFNLENITISDAKILDGVMISNIKGEVQEKFTDLLGSSFDNIYEFRKNDFSNNIRVCNMAAILFKQLKVMHKLPRAYVKPMRIAAYMYDSGKAINFDNYEKYGFYAILNSGLKGVSHKDLLLAGFICLCQNPDNFSLSDWMKYKDILTDEDLDAVRKLGVIVKLAQALNSSKKAVVTDIVCDILGDSIIMKTIVTADASYDILQGMKVATDYRKIYKKNLQII